MTHSPTPYSIDDDGTVIYDADGVAVCFCNKGDQKASAEFLTRAANNYDELVEVLEAITGTALSYTDTTHKNVIRAFKILAKVKGG